MKKFNSSLSRWASGIAILFLVCSISDSCTKNFSDQPVIPPPSGSSGYNINIGAGFNPAEINISAGDMITWSLEGSAIESVTSDNGLFDGIVNANESYTFKFITPGTYTYHSRVHPYMTGKVVVN